MILSLARVEPAPLGAVWKFLCDCGTEGELSGSKLQRNKSCGCLMQEYRNRQKDGFVFKHGHSSTRAKKPSSLYVIWQNMIRRCESPRDTSYEWYGKRGITVCDRWRTDFLAFQEDMGPRPSLGHSVDRRDNDKGYGPDNCFWATRKEQARNRRTSVWLTCEGETKTLAEWAERSGTKAKTIQHRLRLGWPMQDAIFRPVLKLISQKEKHHVCAA